MFTHHRRINLFTRILLMAVLTLAASSLALGQSQTIAANKKATPASAADSGGVPTSNAEIAEAVKALAKAEWALEIRDPNSIAEQSKDYADDFTER